MVGLALLVVVCAAEPPPIRAAVNSLPGGSMACYRNLMAIESRLAELVNLYPNLAEKIDIGNSWEKEQLIGGSDILVLKLTNQSITGDKPKMFVVSGLDARDIMGVELNLRFAERLLSEYDSNPNTRMTLDFSEVHLLMVANPDGRAYLETQFAESRENSQELPTFQEAWGRNRNTAGCPVSGFSGVDLSRNLSVAFMPNSDTCWDDYSGAEAMSEPETKAITNYLKSLYGEDRTDLDSLVPETTPGIVINLTEWAETDKIYHAYHHTADDHVTNQALLSRLAFKLTHPQGVVGIIEIKQPTDAPDSRYGNIIDTSYGRSGVASFEFQLKRFLIPPQFTPCTYFEGSLADRWSEVLPLAARAVARPYEFGQGPEIMSINSALIGTLSPLWSVSGAVDSQFGVLSFPFAPLNPTGVVYSLRTPAWLSNAPAVEAVYVPNSQAPRFGTFNAAFSFPELGPDQSLAFFQSVNVEGKSGIPHAVSIYRRYYLALPVVRR